MISFKKIIAFGAAIGLAGGIIVGASQVSYADVQDAFQGKGGIKHVGFFKDHKAQQGKRLEKLFERIGTYLGMKPEDVKKIMQQEMIPSRQLAVAAVIAKKSNHSLTDVIATIKSKQSWQEVLSTYQLKKEDVRQELKNLFPDVNRKHHFLKKHPALMFDVLAKYLGRTPADIQNALYHSRVHPEGAVKAAILSKASGKRYEDVLALKAQKKTWDEVAQALHVDKANADEAHKQLQDLLKQEVKNWRSQFQDQNQDQN
jgi:predicted transcriptional regulator